MKEITKEEFYDFIGPLNVILSVIGEFPYTTIYSLRHGGGEKGRVIESWTNGIDRNYPIVSKYFIQE